MNQSGTFTEQDYDFSQVSDREVESCLYYEYMRESEAIISEVENVRRQMLQEMKRQNSKNGDEKQCEIRHKKITKMQGLLEGAMISILAGGPEFPIVPWQKAFGFSQRSPPPTCKQGNPVS